MKRQTLQEWAQARRGGKRKKKKRNKKNTEVKKVNTIIDTSRPIVPCILSRGEPSLLRENVEHLIYREGIKHIIVTNHVSIEENHKALEPFKDYIVKQFDEPDALPFPQNEWRTRMCRYAFRELNAAWLVCTDTDEFWYGLKNLYNAPENHKGQALNSIVCKNIYDHYGTMLDPVNGYSIYNMPYYWFSPNRRHGKTIHRGINDKIVMRNCSHKPVQPGTATLAPLSIYQHHYPVRDWNRFLIKVNTACEKNTPGQRRTNWRKLQREDTLYKHFVERFHPPLEILQQKHKNNEVGCFIPPEIRTD